MDVEVPHANLKNTGKASELRSKTSNLSKVTRMVLVEIDPVMMLTTGVSTTSGMLPVLPDPSVSVRHVTSQLPGLLLGCGHCGTSGNIN